jgi:hypothetical protein
MISLKEYQRLLRRDLQVLLVKDLDDELSTASGTLKGPAGPGRSTPPG